MSPDRKREKHTAAASAWLLTCAWCAVTASLFVRCASPDRLAGTGSQAGNGRIACVIYNSDGTPASGAAVYVRSSDYTADTAGAALGKRAIFRRDVRTDAHGALTIDSVDTGSYCIEVNDGKSHAVAFTCSISENDSLKQLPNDTLKPTGAIKGVMDSTPGASVKLYVQVYGLERVGVRDAAIGSFILNDMPNGSFRLRMQPSSNDYRPVDIGGISVAPGVVTDVGNIDFFHLSRWLHSERIYLNTTPSGADVTGAVTGFPILVRLRTGNFDFTQAKADGSDIRFAKADGTPLPFEIERWDPVADLAEVWVKVDTVRGNNSSQAITMYWGNPTATSESKGAAVFDSSAGFEGVWHLGESDSLAPDATVNNYAGTGYFTSPITGMIGTAQHFNGTSSIIRMKGTAPISRLSFSMDGHYTLSAWIYHDRLADSVTYLIAGKGELQYFIKNFDLEVSTPQHQRQWEFTEYHGNNAWQAATFVPATAQSWFHLVGVRDGPNEYLYINGVLATAGYKITGTQQGQLPRDSSDDFSIGGFLRPVADWNQGYAYFNGAIDEVEVSSMPRSTDWIKLSYMNQKDPDALVKW